MTTTVRERPAATRDVRPGTETPEDDGTRADRARTHPRVELAGVVVDLMDQADAVATIVQRAAQPAAADRPSRALVDPPLAVISANLDHIVQFGETGRWRHVLGDSLHPTSTDVDGARRPLEWLTLLDGAPLVAQSSRLSGRPWPRLAGSDLAEPLLDAAEQAGVSVGFVGGSYVVQRLLSRRLTRTRPGLVVAGMWSPDRSELADDAASLRLASAIAAAGPQLLIVGLGKPRQELWISRYGPATGANVLLAFGAVVDFLADAIQRAPRVASDHGLEWAWRLAREPRRLAKRYLLDDPPGLLQLRRHSALLPQTDPPAVSPPPVTPDPPRSARRPEAAAVGGSPTTEPPRPDGTFAAPGLAADVAVLVVTFNSADHIDALLESLRREATGLRLRVVVADNASTDATLQVLGRHSDVIVTPTGGNLGYAAGINVAARAAGEAEALLVLNPDLQVLPGAIAALLSVIRSGMADLVVPRLVDGDGNVQPSLYREPSPGTIMGDAAFGRRWRQRPAALAGTDLAPESYQFGHEIDWATGAAVMVRAAAARRIGEWDERFFLYSEETDYFRRARDLGFVAWYEPKATMVHLGSGSGTSPELTALMAVNVVRYARKYHGGRVPAAIWAGVVLGETLRVHRRDRRGVLAVVADEGRWDTLPGPTASTEPVHVLTDFPHGSVIIPAHNESAVISRTLSSIEPVVRTGLVEVIVVCNGCTDDTAALAAAVPGVRVIEIDVPSKTTALNVGDSHATLWPRVYLDADTEITPTTLRTLLEHLRGPVLAARPAFRYDVGTASWPVRSYYRARRRLPSTNQALWGAGVFGLSEEGHARFGEFPEVTADDYFVDQSFEDDEKMIVPAPPVPVRTPQDVASLLKVLRRNQRGPAELWTQQKADTRRDEARDVPPPLDTVTSTTWELLRSVHGPVSGCEALAYAVLAAVPRVRQRNNGPDGPVTEWERDDSTRRPQPTERGRL
ncbi:polymer biosynthesis protein, WecB/TagA/CpsF family [Raineyella antarctica]|uniref:Polymer biosynthesis protein, WecB/TagA/CpsF family n=1 Tax=Raineyella antarctica TaxID=1577474 RepID=A0A1G6GKQ7_9ACTN|nr:WecB/TagA/CpsF family glycosyltransferase [Raineyella antarctica]SDB82514.1 polymer biosynthesis protein, WecB/TagA/CpsF family [Raineyella antarctica]